MSHVADIRNTVAEPGVEEDSSATVSWRKNVGFRHSTVFAETDDDSTKIVMAEEEVVEELVMYFALL